MKSFIEMCFELWACSLHMLCVDGAQGATSPVAFYNIFKAERSVVLPPDIARLTAINVKRGEAEGAYGE